MRALVTGANRGIGLEIVRQLLARGDDVDACARQPEAAPALAELASPKLKIHKVDVTDANGVRELAAAIDGAALDIVFNVAGLGGGSRGIRQMSEDLVLDDVARTYDINAIGPLRISVALLPNLRRGSEKKLVHITSGMGSIGDNTSG